MRGTNHSMEFQDTSSYTELRRLKSTEYMERGFTYYCLLVNYLKEQPVNETKESVDLYEKMDECFKKQEEKYLTHPKKNKKKEVQDFYRMMERCYNALEFLYERHSFKSSRTAAYQHKMNFRKNAFFFNRNIGFWLEYKFLEFSSSYGTNMVRWAFTTVFFAFMVSFAYMFLDMSVAQELRMIPHNAHWFDYFYFSTVIMTTVGLGDIYPITTLGKVLTATESLCGFLMLGVFIGMLQKRIS